MPKRILETNVATGTSRSSAVGERGSAFVVSILVLFVLSVLGLALMLTTTTETDISVNYRWGEMAFFNADAALEYGKNILASYAVMDGDFRNALPQPRGPAEMGDPPNDADACADPATAGCRDYQYFIDQPDGTRIFIGRILRDPSTAEAIQFDFRDPGTGIRGDIDGDGDIDIEGTVTLWVRRPIEGDADYGYDDTGAVAEGIAHDIVILTAEGTAPNWLGAQGGRPGSLRRLEMTVRIPVSGASGDRYSDVTRGSDTDAVQGSDAAQAGQTAASVQ
ncbi:MAG TPA: pilus assembly PilX N-terminal domain-containing protein [Vicinamibacteria bacterium]